jgi:hypothetical protein
LWVWLSGFSSESEGFESAVKTTLNFIEPVEIFTLQQKGEKMKYKFKTNWLAFLSLLQLGILFAGCVAAVPIAIYYFQAEEGYVATADVKKDADQIWNTLVGMAEKREAEDRIKILKKDDATRVLKVTDDVQTADLKVIAKEKRGSKIIIKTDVPSESQEEELKKEEELAIRIMNNLCEEAKANCKLIEQ